VWTRSDRFELAQLASRLKGPRRTLLPAVPQPTAFEAADLYRREFVLFALLRRVDAVRQELSCLVAFLPRVGEQDFGKGSQPEHELLATEPITEAPEPAATGRDQKM